MGAAAYIDILGLFVDQQVGAGLAANQIIDVCDRLFPSGWIVRGSVDQGHDIQQFLADCPCFLFVYPIWGLQLSYR